MWVPSFAANFEITNNNLKGNEWFVLLGAVACGLSWVRDTDLWLTEAANQIRAGLFWASEGAVALGYPEPAKRGQYMKWVTWHPEHTDLLGMRHHAHQSIVSGFGFGRAGLYSEVLLSLDWTSKSVPKKGRVSAHCDIALPLPRKRAKSDPVRYTFFNLRTCC